MTQIIFSFIPTVIATLLEPFWVLIGRYLALYQPYTELRRGNASPISSLGLKYTNIPPVLIAPRALRHGHIFLFLSSIIVITANLLAVSLGGIFDRSSQPLTSDIIVTYPFTISINTKVQSVEAMGEAFLGYPMQTFARDMNEPWLVVNTNVIEGTDLPPWITDEFYFLPFDWELGSRVPNSPTGQVLEAGPDWPVLVDVDDWTRLTWVVRSGLDRFQSSPYKRSHESHNGTQDNTH